MFCLAELDEVRVSGKFEIFILGGEHAREMSAPVAMSQQNRIYVRQDAFLRMIWEMFEEWGWRKPCNAFYKAISHFGDPTDPDHSIRALAQHELENLVLHERGEVLAGETLGERWGEMVMELTNTALEQPVRAVRDNLADALTVLPKLTAEENAPSIHFYFAGGHPVREQLFPMLKEAYRYWDESRTMAPLRSAVSRGHDHWLGVAQALMDDYECNGAGSGSRLQSIVDSSVL